MIMVHQPVSPYLSAEGWVDYHAAIAETVPDLGVVLYIRDARITGRHIRALGEAVPERGRASSTGSATPVQFAAVARDAGLDRFTWLAGLAELHRARLLGVRRAQGFTSGLANVGPAAVARPCWTRCEAATAAGAMQVWDECRPFEELRAADSSADNVQRGQGGPGPAGPVPAGTSGRPAACCRTRCGTRSARSWQTGADRLSEASCERCQRDADDPSSCAATAGSAADVGTARPSATAPGCASSASSAEEHLGKPIIAIVNTWSELNPCHMHLRERAEQVKRGDAGGRRLPGRVRGGHAVGDVPEADPDAVPEPAGHGHRGTAPVLPGRRRGADGRLRQDHARAAHGRGQRRDPGHLPARRADAPRQLPRQHAWAAAPTCGSTGTTSGPG